MTESVVYIWWAAAARSVGAKVRQKSATAKLPAFRHP